MSLEFEFSQCTLAWQVFRGLSASQGQQQNFAHVCEGFPQAEQAQSCSHRSGLRHTLWDALGSTDGAHTAQQLRTRGEGHSPNPASAHASTQGNRDYWHLENPTERKHTSFKMRRKPFCILFLAGFAEAVEECFSLLYTHECLARPWIS